MQAFLFTTLLVIIPVVATATISTTLIDQDSDLGSASLAGLQVWLLAHGYAITLSGVEITLIPLGITLAALLAARASARRTANRHWRTGLAFTMTYLVLTLIPAVTLGASVPTFLRGTMMTLIFAAGAWMLGTHRSHTPLILPQRLTEMIRSIPWWIRHACRSGAIMMAGVTVVSSLIVAVWLFVGRDPMAQVLTQWSLDAPSGAALGLAQAVFVPTLIAWAGAWVTGGAFTIGDYVHYSQHDVTLGPLPAFPMLASIPSDVMTPTTTWGLASIVALFAAWTGWRAVSRLKSARLSTIVSMPLVAGAVSLLLAAAGIVLTSGAVGPGALHHVGIVLWPSLGALALVLIPAHLVGGVAGARLIRRHLNVLRGRKTRQESATSTEGTTPVSPRTPQSSD